MDIESFGIYRYTPFGNQYKYSLNEIDNISNCINKLAICDHSKLQKILDDTNKEYNKTKISIDKEKINRFFSKIKSSHNKPLQLKQTQINNFFTQRKTRTLKRNFDKENTIL